MDVILVLVLMDRSLVLKKLAIKNANMKAVLMMKENLSLAVMDVILVLALLDRSLVLKKHAIKHANMKAVLMMKENLSLV